MYRTATFYYFSGTGNTKALAEAAGETISQQGTAITLRDVASHRELCPADLIGVFFPVYCFGAPRIIVNFVRSLPPGEGKAAIVVANAAGTAGPAPAAVARALSQKGYHVKLADWVRMPNNYIVFSEADADSKAAEIVAAGRAKVAELLAALGDAASTLPHYSRFGPLALAHRMFLFGLNYMGRFYRANDACTGCGACVTMCPTQCIALDSDARPRWKAGCEHCMCCVNFCPEAAIEFGRSTKGKKRYTYWMDKAKGTLRHESGS
ncbi:MAG: EFR1 family ferrodoxin [Dethiobacter sp.]|nr:EFR1 family ferrodoxin [Dethiobacter sp.]